MNAIEMAEVLDKKYTLPLAHEAAEMIRIQHAAIYMALNALQQGSELDVPLAIEFLKEAL